MRLKLRAITAFIIGLSFFIAISDLAVCEEAIPQKRKNVRSSITSEFIRAYHENCQILFSPPTNIDWSALAPKYLSSINIQNPTKWEMDHFYATGNEVTQSAEYSFDTILDESLSGWLWYLISPSGVSQLEPSYMRGKVVFVNGRKGKIERRYFSGEVLSLRPGGPYYCDVGGGFVIKTKEPLTWQYVKVEDYSGTFILDERLFEKVRESSQTGTENPSKKKPSTMWPSIGADDSIDIRYQFKLSKDGSSFTFVSYREDTKSVTCKYRFAIFLTEKLDKPLAENFYGCDM